MRVYCSIISTFLSLSLFGASQTFLPQGPAPLSAPIVTSPAGPAMNQNGATQAIAINPSNPQNLYIATASGGVWSTSNFGNFWTPLLDQQSNLSVASVAFDPTDLTYKTLVVGTGITTSGSIVTGPPPGAQGGPYPSGLYYTTDMGSSWSSLGAATLFSKSVVNVLARGSTILAATYEPVLLQPNTGYGLFVSTDTGSTFTLAPTGGPMQLIAGPVSSLVNDPSNINTIYAAIYGIVNFQDTSLYKSLDGGSSWQPVFGAAQSGGFINTMNLTSIKTATGPSNSVAIFIIQGFPIDMRVFLSTDGGSSWTQMDVSSIPQSIINVSPELSSIAIDALDPTVVYISGMTTTMETNGGFPGTVYRLKQNGASTEITSLIIGADGSASHADTRMSVSLPSGGLIVTSDGGIALRTNANGTGGNWQSLVGQNLATLECYGSAYDGNHQLVLTSSQDNGTCVQNQPNQPVFSQIYPGDGNQVFVNDKSSDSQSIYYFTSNDSAYPFRLYNNSGSLSEINFIFFNPNLNTPVTPIALNRNDPSWLVLASPDSDMTHTDVSIAQDLGSQELNQTQAGQCTDQAVAFAYGTQDNLQALVACAPGAGLYFTSNATSVDSLALLPAYATQSGNMTPQAAVFDPRAYQRFFVTDSVKVYETINAGAAFTGPLAVPANISLIKTLEFISANGVNALLAGGYSSDPSQSTIAVADSDAGGNLSNWRLFGLGLPDVFVMNLEYDEKTDVLLAGLWGRGAWTMYDVTSNFTSATTLQFGLANNDSTPDASVLTGNRPLNKYGTGTLTISGAASFTGLSTVFEGQMVVNGSIPGSVLVESGAVLRGAGFIGGLTTVANGASIIPGNSIGTITLGSLIDQPNSTTAIQLEPFGSSQIFVMGTANLDGTLFLVQDSGNYADSTIYTILQANGGVMGQFTSIATVSPYGGFIFDVIYSPTLVQLLLKMHLPTDSFSGNDLSFVKYLNTKGIGSAALRELAYLPSSELKKAVHVASPARSTISNFVAAKTIFSVGNGLVNKREAKLFKQFEESSLAKCDFPQMNQQNSPAMLASLDDRVPSGSLIQGARTVEHNGVWINGFADIAQQDAQHQIPAFHFTTLGLLFGYERFMQQGWVGVAAGYANTSVSENHALGSGELNSGFLLPYGTVTFYNAYFEASLIGGYNRARQRQPIKFQGFDETAHCHFNIWQLMPHVGFGYDISWDSLILEPFVAFDFLTAWQTQSRERGSPTFDMIFKRHTSYFLQSEVGLRFYQRCEGDWGTALLLETISYINQAPFGIGTHSATLVGNDAFFTIHSFNKNQNLFGFGVSGMVKGHNGLFAVFSFDGQVGSEYTSYEPQVKLGLLF